MERANRGVDLAVSVHSSLSQFTGFQLKCLLASRVCRMVGRGICLQPRQFFEDRSRPLLLSQWLRRYSDVDLTVQ